MAAQKPVNQAAQQLYRGLVKQVNSGDSVTIRSLPNKDGKTLEKQVYLSYLNAPRLGRRVASDNAIENDEPYAFEAREHLRKKVLGRDVCFIKENTTQSNLDRGQLYLGRDTISGENVADGLVSAGLVEVRRAKVASEEEQRLVALEEQAKNAGVGKWSKDPEQNHVRQMKYSIDNAKTFVESLHRKPVDAIVEYVRDGSTLRLLLLPTYHNITVQLSGIKCPGFKREGNQEVAEPFAEEAKQYVEAKILQNDVQVVLEGVANQSSGILLGTLMHPRGNISEFLLRDGLAKCVDWSMGVVSVGADKYRNAEKQAKQAKLRLWKNFVPTNSAGIDEASKNFTGKVVEVLNGDGMVVKLQDGAHKKIFLSSIRPPRLADFPDFQSTRTEKKGNPLYDVPYLFQAREFLRKKLINKKVQCQIDYIQPKSDDYPEKVCCTVTINDANVAEAIVSQGLARVIRYRQDDNQRSSKYDDLLAAENRAETKLLGVHSKKEPSVMKIADISAEVGRAKQFLPLLQRAGKMDALVEFVSSGSRFKLYIPKETCAITFLLTGIDCPRLARPATNGQPAQPSDEYAEDAYQLSKSLALQREVRIEVEGVDKGGNFLGQLVTDDNVNLSVALVEAGYASVYKTSTLSTVLYSTLAQAETRAKEKRLARWKNYVEEKVLKEEKEKNEPQERVVNHKKILITEVAPDLHFYGQVIENGPKLELLTTQLRAELEARPPIPGAYTPKVGDLCAAKFSMDDEWYRARVLSANANGTLTVLYVDYGNREQTQAVKLAALPAGFDALPAQAHEYALALVGLSSDEDDIELALDRFKELVLADSEAEFQVNSEYKSGTVDFVTLYDSKKNDIGKSLINDGYVSVDRSHKERRLNKLMSEYLKCLSHAKSTHKLMWRYGDKEADDAAEFGLGRK